MKTILEAASTEVSALKKRTIRSLAVEAIEQGDCDYIIKRLDEVLSRVDLIKIKKKEVAHDDSKGD